MIFLCIKSWNKFKIKDINVWLNLLKQLISIVQNFSNQKNVEQYLCCLKFDKFNTIDVSPIFIAKC